MSRSTIEAILAQSAGLSAESWPAALARAIRQGIAEIGSRRRLRRHIAELTALDDRTLRDIGLSRGEIEYAMPRGRPFDRLHDRLPL
jgi:uncharacterized protein YjiS (DUF1127 family)